MLRLSNINKCGLQGYPKNTKKLYSGLVGNWIYAIDYYNPFTGIKNERWEFGWKQKALKLEPLHTYYGKGFSKKDIKELRKHIHNYKEYLIDDYKSCFVVFCIGLYTRNNKVIRCVLSLDSTDDGEFLLEFNHQHINTVKRYFKDNYKTLTLEKIEEFIKQL